MYYYCEPESFTLARLQLNGMVNYDRQILSTGSCKIKNGSLCYSNRHTAHARHIHNLATDTRAISHILHNNIYLTAPETKTVEIVFVLRIIPSLES